MQQESPERLQPRARLAQPAGLRSVLVTLLQSHVGTWLLEGLPLGVERPGWSARGSVESDCWSVMLLS
jgi:hypothetical protein